MDGPRFLEVNGVTLAVWERDGGGPPVLLCHATGFHGRCWNRVVDLLPGSRAIAVDMRGHGLSTKPELPIQGWREFGVDVAAVARRLGLKRAVGAGHSMGGHSLTLAAALEPQAFSELILLDPVILPPEGYVGAYDEPHFARKRRDRWASRDEMFERFRTRPPFDRWDPQVLRDYCDYGLIEEAGGTGFRLACPPDIEGAIYEQSRARESNIHADIPRVTARALVVRSPGQATAGPGVNMMESPTDPQLAARFRDGHDLQVAVSHFIPMEAPELVAGEIRSALRRLGNE